MLSLCSDCVGTTGDHSASAGTPIDQLNCFVYLLVPEEATNRPTEVSQLSTDDLIKMSRRTRMLVLVCCQNRFDETLYDTCPAIS